jgi:hypothetical protein
MVVTKLRQLKKGGRIHASSIPYYYTSETCFLSKVLLDNEPFRLVSEFRVFSVFQPSDGCGGAALGVPWAYWLLDLMRPAAFCRGCRW